MYYHIFELSTVEVNGLTYVKAEAWRSKADHDAAKPVWLTEEFLMQLRPTGWRIVTNADGWLKQVGGPFIDPTTLDPTKPEPEWERETFTRNVAAEIRTNVEKYLAWAKGENLSGDHTSDATKPLYKDGKLVPQSPTALVERDQTDPHAILQRTDVKALKGAKFEVVEAAQL